MHRAMTHAPLFDGKRIPLVPHPGNADREIGVAVLPEPTDDGRWLLDWQVTGDVVIPPPAAPERMDGLWQATCFELFAMRGDGSYLEWNFAPSGHWAAYDFADYRVRTSPPPAVEPPVIAWDPVRAHCRILVEAPTCRERGALRIGLSAVVERTNGEREYFALAHPQGVPDFHSPHCFARAVSPPPGP